MSDEGESGSGAALNHRYPASLTVSANGTTIVADVLVRAPSSEGSIDGTIFDIPRGTRAIHRWALGPDAAAYRHPLADRDAELRLEIAAPGFQGSANAFVAFFSKGEEIEVIRRKVWPVIRDWEVRRPENADAVEFGIELAGTGRFHRLDMKVETSKGIVWAPIRADKSAVSLPSAVRCWPGGTTDLKLNGKCTTFVDTAKLVVTKPPDDDFATSSIQLEGAIDLPEGVSGIVLVRCTATLTGTVNGVISCFAPGTAPETVAKHSLAKGSDGQTDIFVSLPAGSRSLGVALMVGGAGRFERPGFAVLALGAEGSALRDLYALGFDPSSSLSIAQVAARHDAEVLASSMEDLRQALDLKRLPRPLLDLGAFLERADHYGRQGVTELATIDIGTESIILPPRQARSAFSARSNRIAYCVHSALPHHTHGYSTRTHGLMSALLGADWDLRVYSRLGFPDDIDAMAPAALQSMEIDGVPYVTSRLHPLHGLRLPRVAKILATGEYFASVVRDFEPAIVQGASNWTTGLASILAARILGLPSIYEVRGLWHVTRASNQPGYEETEEYAESHRLELECCQAADRVITITHALKRYLVDLGIEPGKISVVPNGVNLGTFVPRARDEELLDQTGLKGRIVFGFVGSLVPYEGVDLIFDAIITLPDAIRAQVGVLIVGDGAALPFLRDRAAQLGLSDVVRFTGRVPFEDVPRYYSIIDVAPFPRRSVPVTELVSPLKPFEAMAMGKTVIASTVEAHREFIEDGVNGRLFGKDDTRDLARVMHELIDDPSSQISLREGAREFIETRRTWSYVTKTLGKVYRDLGAG